MCKGAFGMFRRVEVEEERESSAEGVVGKEGKSVVFDDCFSAWTYVTILTMFPGFEDRAMTVVTPAEVARRAATILVDIPPVPRLDPAEETSASREEISWTTSMGWASR